MPKSARGGKRNRVLVDRLWDEAGREWTTQPAAWLEDKQVQQLIKREQPVVIHGFGRSMRWLDVEEAQLWWSHARPHFEIPGRSGAAPSAEGLTWGAHLWRRLLGFETFC